MSIDDYRALVKLRPDLKLPEYEQLTRSARRRLRRLATRQELITRASYLVLLHGPELEYSNVRQRNFTTGRDRTKRI